MPSVRRWLGVAATGAAVVATAAVVAPGVALASNGRASMTFAVSEQTTVYGSTVTLTAELSDDSGSCISWRDCDTPTGRVAFFDNGTYIGSGILGDHGPGGLPHLSFTQIDTTPTYAGFHSYRAQYAGDFDPVASDDLRSVGHGQPNLTVTQAPCSLSLSVDPPASDGSAPATFTADLGSGPYAGTIDFITGAGPGGSLYWRTTIPTGGHSATFPFPAPQMNPGTYTFHAVFYGDSNHLGCTSSPATYVRGQAETHTGTVVLPEAQDDQFHVDAATMDVDILANDTFVAGYLVEPAIVTPPSHGTASIDPNTLRLIYTPDPGYTGSADALTYRLVDANDGTGYNDAAGVTFNFDCLAAGHDDAFTVIQDTALVTAGPGVLGNDQACGGGAAVASAPGHGTVALDASGGFTYTPAPGFGGLDSFTYTLARDAHAAPVTVSLAVVPADCTVALADDAYVTTGALVVNSPGLTGNDELCGNAIEVAQPPAHGSVTIAPGGGFTYTPDDGYAGADTFTYGVTEVPDEALGQEVEALADGPAATVHLTVRAAEVATTTAPTTATSTPSTTAPTTSAATPTAPAPTDPAPSAPSGATLPTTGSTPTSLALAALAVIIAGAALVRITRRRPAP